MAEVKSSKNDGPAKWGEVVLVGAADFSDQATQVEAAKKTGDLRTGLVLEDAAQAAAGETGDVEFSAQQGDEDVEVVAGEG